MWILPLFAASMVALQYFFPLRQFVKSTQMKNLIFHFIFALVVLFEVRLLGEWKIFPEKQVLSIHFGNKVLDLVICLFILDLFSYFWHRLNHRCKFFWFFHSFHHKATTLDPLAAYRFHPVEVFMGFQLRAFFVWILGFQRESLEFFVIFYGILNLYQHSNFQVPAPVENMLSKVFVTPSLHHVHHLKKSQFQHSNFSTIFVMWDHIFKSFSPPQKIQNDDLGVLAPPVIN